VALFTGEVGRAIMPVDIADDALFGNVSKCQILRSLTKTDGDYLSAGDSDGLLLGCCKGGALLGDVRSVVVLCT